MGLLKLKTYLQSSGMPVTYRAWPEGEAPSLPFICYLANGNNPLFADGGVYHSSQSVRVELYTRLKDPTAEAAVEAALSAYHWKKYPDDYISSEQCYLILYEVEV